MRTLDGLKAGTTEYRLIIGIYTKCADGEAGDVQRMEDGKWVDYQDEWSSALFSSEPMASAHAKRATKGEDAEVHLEEILWVKEEWDDDEAGHVVDASPVTQRRRYAQFTDNTLTGWSAWEEAS